MKDLLQELVQNFDPNDCNELASEKDALSFWVLIEDKVRYEQLQSKTKKKFGEHLKRMLTEAIRQCHAKLDDQA